jgi:putative transposase
VRALRGRDNHVYLILTPGDPAGLALALARARRLYAGFVNARARQTGRLYRGRFGSVAMDEDHLMAAARNVALNPAPARGAPGIGPIPALSAHLAGP